MFTERVIFTGTQRGLSAALLWSEAGITADQARRDPRHPVLEERHLAVWERVIDATRDRAVCLEYARNTTIDGYGVIGLACKTAPSVAGALELLARSVHAYASGVEIEVRTSGDGLVLAMSSLAPPGVGRNCQIESGLAEVWSAIRAIAAIDADDARAAPVRVTFAHEAPDEARTAAQFGRFFSAPLVFRSRDSSLVLPESLLARPLLRADAALHAFLTQTLASLRPVQLDSDDERGDRERVRAAVLERLPQPPRAGVVARALGLSVRSLQRRLFEQGCTFDDVVGEARREVADAMLANPDITVAEVAAATGFSEPSAFSRAYKRWTTRSPRAGIVQPRR